MISPVLPGQPSGHGANLKHTLIHAFFQEVVSTKRKHCGGC